MKIKVLTGFINVMFITLILSVNIKAQPIKIDNAGELQEALEKLNVLGSVLYIAAHPDDENSSLIAYLANGRKYRTAYLSLNRGSGGQNLVGSEKGVEIGILRTQELLDARRIDGGEQYFSRALDFGYSKTAKETFDFWGRENILKDVVWIIRKFKPDVIITRFPVGRSGGHGNHTASALLAEEAFHAAADPNKFPDQLKYVQPWQAKRILWNTYSWASGNTHGSLSVDVGTYNPLIGKSYTELGALSRSMQKSQGVGTTGSRGSRLERFQFVDGDSASNDIFEGINTTWSRVKGGEDIGKQIEEVLKSFNPDQPASSIPALVKIYDEMNKIKDNYWALEKKKELLNIIRSCAGLWMEAMADDYSGSPGSTVKIKSTFVNRSAQSFKLEKIEFPSIPEDTIVNLTLNDNKPASVENEIHIPESYPISQPYWLVEKPSKGSYNVSNQQMIGLPENPPSILARFYINCEGASLEYNVPVMYRWNDRVDGEKYRAFEIRPPVMANVENNVSVFPDDKPKEVQIKLNSDIPDAEGIVRLQTSGSWKVTPAAIHFKMKNKYDEDVLTFEVTPPKNQDEINAKIIVTVNGKDYRKGLVEISYPYIRPQVYFPESEVRLVRLNIKKFDENIGYIMGPGDDVPDCLRNMGYKVTLLDDNALEQFDLSKYDVIITGIRAYDIRKELKYVQPKLMNFVKDGGTLIVQYVRPRDVQVDNIGPYPITLSQDRITDETAVMNFVNPNHQLLNFPNKITEKDFDGWVQERGLYFASQWSDKYQPILYGHDPDENDLKGGMLFTRFGKGIFIYTGLAWFRQLPDGVPGAYRIFANMISAGKYSGKHAN
jgi:LmbE family N-acetylglucosaminyl deacetylase